MGIEVEWARMTAPELREIALQLSRDLLHRFELCRRAHA